jgi:ketosteroid isomerase-like protein
VSEADVEVVQRLNAEPGVGVDMKTLVADEELVAAMWEGDFLPDAEWVLAEDEHTGLGGSYRGVEGFRRAMSDWLSAWETYMFIPERIIDAGDCVIVLARDRGRSRTAGLEIESEAATVWWFEGGKVRRVEAWQSHERALRSAGAPDAR